MGTKLLWTGLTIISTSVVTLPAASIVGSVFMIIGLILLWADR